MPLSDELESHPCKILHPRLTDLFTLYSGTVSDSCFRLPRFGVTHSWQTSRHPQNPKYIIILYRNSATGGPTTAVYKRMHKIWCNLRPYVYMRASRHANRQTHSPHSLCLAGRRVIRVNECRVMCMVGRGRRPAILQDTSPLLSARGSRRPSSTECVMPVRRSTI